MALSWRIFSIIFWFGLQASLWAAPPDSYAERCLAGIEARLTLPPTERESLKALLAWDDFVTQHAELLQVWPGFRYTAEPLFIVFPSGHIYTLHAPRDMTLPEPGAMTAVWQALPCQVTFLERDRWELHWQSLQPVALSGVTGVVLTSDTAVLSAWPGLGFSATVAAFQLHQLRRFHLLQPPHYVDALNLENLVGLVMEDKALLAYLLSRSRTDLLHFLAIHLQRIKRLNVASLQTERILMRRWGSALYVAYRYWQHFKRWNDMTLRRQLADHFLRVIQQQPLNQTEMRQRFGVAGSILSLGLEQLIVDQWPMKVEQYGQAQTEVFQRALYIAPKDQRIHYMAAEQEYGYQALQPEVRRKFVDYQNEIKAYKRSYLDRDAVIIQLNNLKHLQLRAEKPGRMYLLEDANRLYAKTKGTWVGDSVSIAFELEHLYRLQRHIILYKDDRFRFKVDGTTVTLADIERIKHPTAFASLEIQGEHSLARLQRSGKIFSRVNRILVTLDPD